MAGETRKLSSPELARAAMESVRTWEQNGKTGANCPVCGSSDVQIVDRSARPHMLWYAFSCGSCGLDEAVALPLVAHSADHD